ncbi:unnamed protein product [Orchesella dallaii]|uniref:G-protein coupled receptors family 2 profile 2 domain-containing protein n=1 Tax=Orchesella dallaii TaxID=48710 RepID=A0ABP1S8P9_9HEXA
MRILLTKVQRPSTVSDSAQLRRAVKATFVLFPLLGINNLLFLYNPGGDYNKCFVILNAVFGSTQGISVAVLYCFVNKDVRDAIHRLVQRYTVRRTANSMRLSNSRGSSVVRQSLNRSRTHFLTKFRREQETELINGGRKACNSSSPELVMVHQLLPTSPGDITPCGDRGRDGSSHDCFPQQINVSTTVHTNQRALVGVDSSEL